MKANLNYFYKFHHKNIKKLYFFSKRGILYAQKLNIIAKKKQNVKNASICCRKNNIPNKTANLIQSSTAAIYADIEQFDVINKLRSNLLSVYIYECRPQTGKANI
jgi:hypothetical protein